jgi:predicted dienelactone hydrolase
MDRDPFLKCLSILSLALGILAVAHLTSPRDVQANAGCRLVGKRASWEFAVDGPYPVGVRTVTFVDTSRPTAPNGDFPGAPERTLVTEIWYPALGSGRDVPVDAVAAPYPVVIHSHGFLDSRAGEAFVSQHLASRGYIVAATDYPLSHGGAPGGATVSDVHNQPGDWSFILDQILAEFGEAADSERIGASGLSLGGLTTLLVTYHRDLRDPRIRAALPMAGPGCFFTRRFFRTTEVPLLVLHGDSDLIVPVRENGRRGYRRAPAPKFLVQLRNGSHTGFSGFATLFDQSQHFDGIGCTALVGDSGIYDPNDNPFEELGGKSEGILLDMSRCPLPCEEGVPDGPSMGAVRHHELTRIVASAFFDAYLRGDDTARCFLRHTLRRENGDVSVRSRGSRLSVPLPSP